MPIIFLLILFPWVSGYAADQPWAVTASCYYTSYEHEQQNQYAEAIKDLDPVYNTYPNSYTVNYRIGWLYYLNRNYPKALDHLRKALTISPGSIEVMNTITLVHAANLDWPQVYKITQNTIKRESYNITANYWFSYSLKMQKKYDLAIKVDRKMLLAYPTSAIFLQELGENLALAGKHEESITVFQNLKILSPAAAGAALQAAPKEYTQREDVEVESGKPKGEKENQADSPDSP